jgi:hypothetical protein
VGKQSVVDAGHRMAVRRPGLVRSDSGFRT